MIATPKWIPRVAAPLVLLTLWLSPRSAPAVEFELLARELSFCGTTDFTYTYFSLDDPQYDGLHRVVNVLDLTLSTGDIRLAGRFDLFVFGDRPIAQPGRFVNQYLLYREQAISPERLSFEVARPELDLTLGDFYASFGKGLALNVVKIDALGQDTAIRGGKLKIHHADLGLTFLAGEFNPLDVDNATGKVAPWRIEPIVAGEVEYRFFDTVLAGAHAVLVIADHGQCAKQSPGETVLPSCGAMRTDHHAIWGARFEAPELFGGRLSLGGEVDLQRTMNLGEVVRGPDREQGGLFSDARGPGLAIYTTATLQLGEVTLLGELKHYDDFQLKAPEGTGEPYQLLYHQPPTLERVRAELTDNRTVTGGRLRIDYSLSDDLLLFANYGFFDSRFGGEHQVHDPFAGFEWTWQEGDGHLNLTSGARYETDRAAGELSRLDVHVELDVEQALFSTHAVKVAAFYQHRRKRLGILQEWNELDTVLEYKWSPHLAAAFTVELQSDSTTAWQNEVYLGGSVRYFLDPSSFVGVRVGQNRGGLKCLNGTCRIFPPFAGAQVFATARW